MFQVFCTNQSSKSSSERIPARENASSFRIWEALTMLPPIIRCSPWRMRRRFNRGRYHQRTLTGQLTVHINRNTHPSRTEASEPFCTQTQEISYFDGPVEVVRIHQYLRPDDTLGASGQPDPKRIFEGGILYRLRKPAKTWREEICYFTSDWSDRLCWFFGIEVD